MSIVWVMHHVPYACPDNARFLAGRRGRCDSAATPAADVVRRTRGQRRLRRLKARRQSPFSSVLGDPSAAFRNSAMYRRQRDIDNRNREMDALAERWELRIHAIALTLTAIVLAMRLVAGREDLTSDGADWPEPSGEPSVVAAPAARPPSTQPALGAPEPLSTGERGTTADTPREPLTSPHLGAGASLSAR